MRSSMVLTTSGKPRRKSAASCLAVSACSAAKSSSAASRSPVWFQSSCCSLRTRSLFSCADIGLSLPDGQQHSVHDATRRYPVHPGVMPQPRGPRGGAGGDECNSVAAALPSPCAQLAHKNFRKWSLSLVDRGHHSSPSVILAVRTARSVDVADHRRAEHVPSHLFFFGHTAHLGQPRRHPAVLRRW